MLKLIQIPINVTRPPMYELRTTVQLNYHYTLGRRRRRRKNYE